MYRIWWSSATSLGAGFIRPRCPSPMGPAANVKTHAIVPAFPSSPRRRGSSSSSSRTRSLWRPRGREGTRYTFFMYSRLCIQMPLNMTQFFAQARTEMRDVVMTGTSPQALHHSRMNRTLPWKGVKETGKVKGRPWIMARGKVEATRVLNHLTTTTSRSRAVGAEPGSHMTQSRRSLTTTISPTHHLRGVWDPDLAHVRFPFRHQDLDRHPHFHRWIKSGGLQVLILVVPPAPLDRQAPQLCPLLISPHRYRTTTCQLASLVSWFL